MRLRTAALAAAALAAFCTGIAGASGGGTCTDTETETPTDSTTPTPSDTATPTATATPSETVSTTSSASVTSSRTATASRTATSSRTATISRTPTISGTPTSTRTSSHTISLTPTISGTPTRTATVTPTQPAIEPFLWTSANSFTPARGALRIAFETVENAPARLEVFNTAGERIAKVFSGSVVGWTLIEAAWDGRNDGGEACSSGVYLLRLSTKRRVLWRRVGLAR